MTRLAAVLLLALVPAMQAAAAGPYDDLLKLVPPGTNTLALVNVKAAYASPLAKAEKWAEDYNKRYRAGIGFVPADAEVVAVATDVNLSSMTRDYQTALVRAGTVPTIKELADRTGGTVDRVADRTTVLTPQGVYYVPLTGQIFSAVYPTNRQATARWVRYAAAPKAGNLSPYLQKAADEAADEFITVAVDLSDSADQNVIKSILPATTSLIRNKGTDDAKFARLMATARGVTLGVKITGGITATVRVDFEWSVAPFRRIARDMLLEVLDQHGVFITGMSAWEATYEDKSMTLSGTLTATDMRRILSLFAFPGHTEADDEEMKAKPDQVSVAATKRYLAAVDVVLGDLRAAKDSPDYLKMAAWNEKAADQIDHLRTKAVDKVAADAAGDVSKRLRAIGGSLRGVPINLEAVQRTAYYYTSSNVGVSVGWWGVRPVWTGGATVNTNLQQVQREKEKLIDDDRKQRTETWIQIDVALSDARRKLQDKYKERF